MKIIGLTGIHFYIKDLQVEQLVEKAQFLNILKVKFINYIYKKKFLILN